MMHFEFFSRSNNEFKPSLQGKDLYMDLDHQNLMLIDPQDMTVLNVQPIQSIRVWGVGRDNGRSEPLYFVQQCEVETTNK